MSARATVSGVIGLLVTALVLPALWAAAPWASVVDAASCNGNKTGLTSPAATPLTGTTSTVVRFSVRYSDTSGCAPLKVEVVVFPGATRTRMTATSTSWSSGVIFKASRKLPVGTWVYQFVVTPTGGPQQPLTITGPGKIVIAAAPSATPKPTAKPTPRPTAKPTPRPTAKPTARPTPKPTSKPKSKPKPSSSVPAPAGGGTTDGSARSEPSGSDRAGLGGAGVGGPGGRRTGPDDDGDGSPGGGLPPAIAVAILAALGGAGILLVGRRRRDAALEPTDAAVGHEAEAVASVLPVPADGLDGVLGWDPERSSPAADRPSTPRPPQRFARPPAAGVERRIIAYQYVKVTDLPDDLHSREVGRVDRRDEVELIGEEAGFLRIRTADGIEGWVPRVVVVGAPTADRIVTPAHDQLEASRSIEDAGPAVVEPVEDDGAAFSESAGDVTAASEPGADVDEAAPPPPDWWPVAGVDGAFGAAEPAPTNEIELDPVPVPVRDAAPKTGRRRTATGRSASGASRRRSTTSDPTR